MGKVKEWTSIINMLAEGDMFDAVLTFLPYEEWAEKEKRGGAKRGYAIKEGQSAIWNEEIKEASAREEIFETSLYEVRRSVKEEALVSLADFWENVPEAFLEEGFIDHAFSEYEKRVRYAYENEGDFTEYAHNSEALGTLNSALEDFGYGYDKEDNKEAFGRDLDMKLSRDMRERILESVLKESQESCRNEIRVEMVNESKKGEDVDMDELIEEMTARLCDMMTRGADGIYI